MKRAPHVWVIEIQQIADKSWGPCRSGGIYVTKACSVPKLNELREALSWRKFRVTKYVRSSK